MVAYTEGYHAQNCPVVGALKFGGNPAQESRTATAFAKDKSFD